MVKIAGTKSMINFIKWGFWELEVWFPIGLPLTRLAQRERYRQTVGLMATAWRWWYIEDAGPREQSSFGWLKGWVNLRLKREDKFVFIRVNFAPWHTCESRERSPKSWWIEPPSVLNTGSPLPKSPLNQKHDLKSDVESSSTTKRVWDIRNTYLLF